MSNIEKEKILVAVYLILEKEGKILMLRRFNTGYEDGKYGLIAGHVDSAERGKEAMVREAMEEAGIVVEEDQLEVVHVMHRESTNSWYIDIFMKAGEWERAPRNMEPNKCDDMRWFDKTDMPENIIPYLKVVLERVERGETYSEETL